MKKSLLILAAALLGLVSCRSIILEERDGCPSFLFFRIDNESAFQLYERIHVGLFRYPEENLMAADTTSVSEIAGRSFYFDIRNTPAVEGYGLLGYRHCVNESGTLWRVPVGAQYDSLFRFSYRVPVERESFTVPVEFTKEHVKVTLRFIGADAFASSTGGRFPFDVVVRGNTCGMDALTGIPVRGPFEYRPREEGMGCFHFILPRILDHDLALELYGRPGVAVQEGHTDTFDLWKLLLEKGGITWQEKNLPDVEIVLDYRDFDVKVNVQPWGSQDIHFEF